MDFSESDRVRGFRQTVREFMKKWTHERGGRIYDGADEAHIISVAKRILRRYGGEQ
jgi:hypothetical protein